MDNRVLKCMYCETTNNLTREHIVPKSLGGSKKKMNLGYACIDCNQTKDDLLIPSVIEKYLSIPIALNWIHGRMIKLITKSNKLIDKCAYEKETSKDDMKKIDYYDHKISQLMNAYNALKKFK